VVCAVPLVIILNDVLDAHETLFARLDFLHEVVEVAVELVAATVDLVVVVTVRGYEFGDDLVCDNVFPVGAGG
jgi:hypothetical protein